MASRSASLSFAALLLSALAAAPREVSANVSAGACDPCKGVANPPRDGCTLTTKVDIYASSTAES